MLDRCKPWTAQLVVLLVRTLASRVPNDKVLAFDILNTKNNNLFLLSVSNAKFFLPFVSVRFY